MYTHTYTRTYSLSLSLYLSYTHTHTHTHTHTQQAYIHSHTSLLCVVHGDSFCSRALADLPQVCDEEHILFVLENTFYEHTLARASLGVLKVSDHAEVLS